MCQSHMEAPAVAGTLVGTETWEKAGALWCGGYRFGFGRKLRKVLVLDLVLRMGLCLGLALWKGPDWECSWMRSLCCS